MVDRPYTTDTSTEADRIELELLRRMTPSERVQKAIALSNEVAHMCKAAIRRRHPDFDDNEVSLKFIELNYGRQLSDEVRAWRIARKRTQGAADVRRVS